MQPSVPDAALVAARSAALRSHFGIEPAVRLLDPDVSFPELTPQCASVLSLHNFEWHLIPSFEAVPFDEAYRTRMYAHAPATFASPLHHGPSARDLLATGHLAHQGRLVAVETTMKPRYLPRGHQSYGTAYGFDPTADPLSEYLGRAGFDNEARFDHSYLRLRALVDLLDSDWRRRGVLPAGFKVSICPPVIFNLVGTIFHPEWSETESLELGFYPDAHGNALCFAVGSSGPGDYSYVHLIETNADWAMLGFRLALLPE
jgi:hypothetical protein